MVKTGEVEQAGEDWEEKWPGSSCQTWSIAVLVL